MDSRDVRETQAAEELAGIRGDLRQRKAKIKCKEACEVLQRLGFDIRDGKKGGHKIYVHDHLPSFTSSSLDCGHGRDPEIKPAYIQKIITVLTQYEDELVNYMLQEK